MYKNTRATSIVESMVVMLIIVTGITGMYSIFTQSQRLSNTTGHRIEAIQIAREGIEAFTNIRNTNWILFAADYKNCWNTLNYNNTCIGDDTNSQNTDITSTDRYVVYPDESTNRWMLESRTGTDYSDTLYRDNFRVNKDSNGLYTQSGGTLSNPIFTREIQIEYIEDTNGVGGITSDDEKMKITSTVQWLDNAKATPHSIELEMILTNWKHKAN